MKAYGEYDNCEIMTREEMYDRGISEPWYRDEEMDEILFVRWDNDGNSISYQPLENLCVLIDKLDELFR